jgi:hypothetical protein
MVHRDLGVNGDHGSLKFCASTPLLPSRLSSDGSGSGSPRSARREGGDEDRLKELLREEREKVAASEAKRVELEGVLRRMVAEAGGVLG